MSQKAPITQPTIARFMKAAEKHGLQTVMTIAGGVITIRTVANDSTTTISDLTSGPQLRDAREKFRRDG
jgi:hypothetical protein